MKVTTSWFNEITDIEKKDHNYITTQHAQKTYHFVCETGEDENKVLVFLAMCLQDKEETGDKKAVE